MAPVLFFILAAACAGSVLGMILCRDRTHGALLLVLAFAALGGIFGLLDAPFVAAVQVLVYAGAIMVLFLFVIMLLDLKAEERRKLKAFAVAGGLVSVGSILTIFLSSLWNAPLGASDSPVIEGGTVRLGKLLFTQYLLPFEIVSLILLVGMVGVVLLSKKDLK